MNKITKLLTNVMCNEFFPFVESKTGVEISELIKCWDEFNRGDVNVKVERPIVMESLTHTQQNQKKVYSATELNKLKIKDLKVICEELKISKSGVKQQIIDKILSKCCVKDNVDEKVSEVEKRTSSDEELNTDDESKTMKKREKMNKCRVDETKKVVKRRTSSDEELTSTDDESKDQLVRRKIDLEKLRAPAVKITQNENGHWIHKETNIVFTSDEEYIDGIRCRLAIGYEDEDGNVEDLTSDMIDTCNQYGFRYREPTNIII